MKSNEKGTGPSRRAVLKGALAGTAALTTRPLKGAPAEAQGRSPVEDPRHFRSRWAADTDRVWIGPEYWANRLQDWRVQNGRLECVQAAPQWPMRTVHLLTRRLGSGSADFALSVRTGPAGGGSAGVAADAAVGFLIGPGGEKSDYRAAALVHHTPGPGGGYFAGMDGSGNLFIRDFESPRPTGARTGAARAGLPERVTLRLTGSAVANGGFQLTLSAEDPAGRPVAKPVSVRVDPGRLGGNVALVSHPGTGPNSARFWFEDWIVAGPGVGVHPDRSFGPILSTLYTVQDRVLKLTAQLAPVDTRVNGKVLLQVLKGDEWKTIATAPIITPGYTATFRVEKWDASRDISFRVVYELPEASGKLQPHTWEGTVRRDPAEKKSIVVASLSCVQQVNGQIGGPAATYRWTDRVWFPHADLTPNLEKHRPDLYFFAGDQIYEGNPTRVVRSPEDEAKLDYLYKWYLWCWAFGPLVRHTPCITIPDDHDVYQGNIWGDGGRPSAPGDPAGLNGGYGMSPAWLNMMQRTQTSHLPDPYDPTPAEQGIQVYYTQLTLGGIGFAILEDRKFKTAPDAVKAEKTLDNHIIEPGYDTRKADIPGGSLLGDRQLKFLREFASDWRGQELKAALSQTIFCNLQISSRGTTVGKLDQDLDSGGWPQRGRNAALKEMRRGFMVHLAGDQHLASAVHHGTDEWEDAVWSLCSPSISNLYIRYWNPDYPPVDGKRLDNPFSGRYEDGFHNKMTVHAVANPVETPKPGEFPEPVELHRKATGYCIVRFNKPERTIVFEVWPRYADPTEPSTGAQYPGWPMTIRQADNYRRQPTAFLPEVVVRGMQNAVLQVIYEPDAELVYALRLNGDRFRPGVFREGNYTLVVGEPGTKRIKRLERVTATKEPPAKPLIVRL